MEYGSGHVGAAELAFPPAEVIWGVAGWGVREERTVIEGAKHGFQAGEKSASCRDDHGCMLKLAVELLHLEEVVGMPLLSLCDSCQVFGFLLLGKVHNVRMQIPAESQVGDLCPEGD